MAEDKAEAVNDRIRRETATREADPAAHVEGLKSELVSLEARSNATDDKAEKDRFAARAKLVKEQIGEYESLAKTKRRSFADTK